MKLNITETLIVASIAIFALVAGWWGLQATGLIGSGNGTGTTSEQAASEAEVVDPEITVAATIFPIYDMVRTIGGETVGVELILDPGASPHTFEPTPQQIARLRGSEAIFTIDYGIDSWSSDIAKAAGISEIIVLDENVELMHSDDDHNHDHDHDHDTDHDEDEQFSGIDPHYWLSVPNAKGMSDQITAELSRLYPEQAETFAANNTAYQAELDVLATEMQQQLSTLNSDGSAPRIAVFHNAWSYFERDHTVNIVASFEPFPGESPSAQYLQQFQETVQRENVSAVFGEPQFSTQELEPVAADLGLSIGTIDPVGGVEGRDSYLEMMRYNTEQIVSTLQSAE